MKLSTAMTKGMKLTRPITGVMIKHKKGASLPKACALGACLVGARPAFRLKKNFDDDTIIDLAVALGVGPAIPQLPGYDPAESSDLADQITIAFDSKGWTRRRIRNALRKAGL